MEWFKCCLLLSIAISLGMIDFAAWHIVSLLQTWPH